MTGARLKMTTAEQELVLVDCASCAIQFAVPARFDNARRETGKDFWCPNGHSLSYKGELDKLRHQLRSEEARRVAAEDQRRAADEARKTAERQAAAARGQVTRLKRRVGNGVCPCCKRTFAQLARHMESKHPGYQAEGIQAAKQALQYERVAASIVRGLTRYYGRHDARAGDADCDQAPGVRHERRPGEAGPAARGARLVPAGPGW